MPPTSPGNGARRGAGAVTAGVLVSGLATYVFLVVVARGLGPAAYAPFAVGWSVSLVAAAGLFAPLEQEAARRVAAARAAGTPVARETGLVGGLAVVLAVAGVLLLLLADVSGVDALARGSGTWWALLAVTASSAAQMPARGVLSGSGRLGRYGAVVATEAVVRMVLAGVLVVLGVSSPGAFLALVAVGAAVSVAVAVAAVPRRGPRDARASTGLSRALLPRRAEVAGAGRALAVLVVGTLTAQLLLNAGPVVLDALSAPGEPGPGRLLAGLSLARVPLFLFTAVQAALIPRLVAQAAAGDLPGLRRTVGRLLAVVAGLTAVASVGSLLVGRPVVALLFGEGFALPGRDLALLSLAVGAYLVALSAAASLVALDAHAAVLRGWVAGLVVHAAVTAVVPDLLLRVELGFLAGAAVAAGVQVVELVRVTRRLVRRAA